jgi:hypothetical protein
MNKQVIIFFCFNNVEHIKIAFDSTYQSDIDYFIVENKSNYSEEIKNYFLEQKKTRDNIVGYIQFEKNISSNAMNIFIRKYGDFLRKYEYITFTDGDYYIYDIKSTIQEMLMAFNRPDCAISSVDLYWGNHISYEALFVKRTATNKRVVGTNFYDDFMKKRENMMPDNVVGIGVPCLMTLQKKDLYILETIFYYDGNIRNKVNEIGKKWYITTKNLSYHLTNDFWHDDGTCDEYMRWKVNYGQKIWHITEESDYVIII